MYSISPHERTRGANWETVGDTLTIDATDGDRWQYVSLAKGHVLTPPDTNGWDIAVQRYRVMIPVSGSIIDFGRVAFEEAESATGASFMPAGFGRERPNPTIDHWYRYNLLTHLLEPDGHVFAIHSGGASWRLAVVSYYCPKLVAGCMTIRYAPLRRALAR